MKTGTLFLLILVISCNTKNNMENEQFIIADIPNEIKYEKVESENDYDVYTIYLEKEASKYNKKDNVLLSKIRMTRFTDEEINSEIPNKDLKRGLLEYEISFSNQINEEFLRSNSKHPYSNAKINTSKTKVDITCDNIEAINTTYDYYSESFNKKYKIWIERFFLKENDRFWHLCVYVPETENHEEIKLKFLKIINKIKFKKKQPNILYTEDLN